MKDKKIWLKIIVPIVIIAVIASMWVVKNEQNKEIVGEDTAQEEKAETQLIEDVSEELVGADFTLNITEQLDFEALAEYELPIVADYGSDSCIPCKEMAPVLKTMNEEFEGKAFIKFADVWKNQNAAGNVPVQVIPTQILVNADGTPFVPSEELAGEIEFVTYSDRESGEHVFTVHQGGLTEEQFRKILKEMGVE